MIMMMNKKSLQTPNTMQYGGHDVKNVTVRDAHQGGEKPVHVMYGGVAKPKMELSQNSPKMTKGSNVKKMKVNLTTGECMCD